MRLVKANEVQRLTGLSADQLREWTVRRGLIEPDAKPHGPGSRALFSWQTVLLLRIAMSLKEDFHVELQSLRALFAALSRRLRQASFPSLTGSALVVSKDGTFNIVELEQLALVGGDALILQLDPHIELLAAEFALAEPMSQLPLFPVLAVA